MLINGRYKILKPLQEGGFGHTFLAEDTQLPSRRRCVIKQLKPVQNNPEVYRRIQERFQREAVIQEKLGQICPQIPQVYAYFTEGEQFYLVLEWIEGETLRQRLVRKGLFSEAQVRDVLIETLSIIETIHQNQIIHRDIKPDNIILRKCDGRPVLIDFGAVKESMATLDAQSDDIPSIVIGTTGFMAPEQSVGHPLFSSDLYSLALTAIFLLTGRTSIDLKTNRRSGRLDWRSQVPEVSESFARAIQTATHMHPSERFVNAQAMRLALQVCDLAHTPTTSPNLQSLPVLDLAHAPTMSPSLQTAGPVGSQSMSPSFEKLRTSGLPPMAIVPRPSMSLAPLSLQNIALTPVSSASATFVPQFASLSNPSHSMVHWIEDVSRSGKRWFKVSLAGWGLGGALLLGFVLAKGQTPNYVVVPASSPTVNTIPVVPRIGTSKSLPVAVRNIAPLTPPSSEPASISATETVMTPSTTCGDQGRSGDIWYPVLMDPADLERLEQQNCRYSIAKTFEAGTQVLQVASFTDRNRATAFAMRVGGRVGQPYQVSPLPSQLIAPAPSNAASAPISLPVLPNAEANTVILSNKSDNNDNNIGNSGRGSDTDYDLAPLPAPSVSPFPVNAPDSNFQPRSDAENGGRP